MEIMSKWNIKLCVNMKVTELTDVMSKEEGCILHEAERYNPR